MLRNSFDVRASCRMSTGPRWPRIWTHRLGESRGEAWEEDAYLEEHVHWDIEHLRQLAQIPLEGMLRVRLGLVGLDAWCIGGQCFKAEREPEERARVKRTFRVTWGMFETNVPTLWVTFLCYEVRESVAAFSGQSEWWSR